MLKKIIRNILISALLFFCAGVISFSASAAAKVCDGYTTGSFNGLSACTQGGRLHICDKNFPDNRFRYHLSELFKAMPTQIIDNTVLVSQDVVASVTELNCPGQNILSLQGIGFFPNLLTLDCSRNLLASLDLSQNTKLTDLNCSANDLISLTVNSPSLQRLLCYRNELGSLNSIYAPNLLTLECFENALFSLNFPFEKLQNLQCNSNQIKSLDLRNFPSLKHLFCGNNRLSALDLTHAPGLISLDCSFNRMKELNVRVCSELVSLSCRGNLLSALDVSGMKSLQNLLCNGNNIESLNLRDTNPVYLDCRQNDLSSLLVPDSITTLFCDDNHLDSLDLRRALKLRSLTCGNNRLTSLDLSHCSLLQTPTLGTQTPPETVTCLPTPNRLLDLAALLGTKSVPAVESISAQFRNGLPREEVPFNGDTGIARLPDGEFTLTIQYLVPVGSAGATAVMKVSFLVQCHHEWNAATCTTRPTCMHCYAQTGNYAEHTWQEATATLPKHCAVCDATDGHPLEHVWEEATCQMPEHCRYCSRQKGGKIPHQWDTVHPCDDLKTCKSCGRTTNNDARTEHAFMQTDCRYRVCSVCGASERLYLEVHKYTERTIFKRPYCLRCGVVHKLSFLTANLLPFTATISLAELFAAVLYLLDYKRERKY